MAARALEVAARAQEVAARAQEVAVKAGCCIPVESGKTSTGEA